MDLIYLPEFCPQLVGGDAEVKDELEPAEEGLVDVVDDVGDEDDHARETLDVVEQHAHVHVGIAIGGGTRGQTNSRIHKHIRGQ